MISARLQAWPRAQRVQPRATTGAHCFRVPCERRHVLRLLAPAPEPPALRRAEPLIVRDGQELAPAPRPLTLSVRARQPESHPRRPTRPTGSADALISVRREELERTAEQGLAPS